MAGHDHVQAGGVTAAHLEPIDRRKRNLDREEVRRGGTRWRAAREILDRAGHADAVVADRPHRVLRRDQRRVHCLDVVRVRGPAIEAHLDRAQQVGAELGVVFQRHPSDGITDQRGHPVAQSQLAVDPREQLGNGIERGDRGDGECREPRLDVGSAPAQRRKIGQGADTSLPDNRHDSAHRGNCRAADPAGSGTPELGLHHAPQSLGPVLRHRLCVRLDHDPDERFGARARTRTRPVSASSRSASAIAAASTGDASTSTPRATGTFTRICGTCVIGAASAESDRPRAARDRRRSNR